MAIDRRLLLHVDALLVVVTLLLAAIGVAMITSAAPVRGAFGVRQAYAVGIGLALLVASLAFDYRRLVDRAVLFYLLAALVLVYQLVAGPRIAGTRRWLVLASFQIQPSEFVKLVVSLFVAKIFSESRKESLVLSDLLGPALAVGALFLLVAAQPDLGTAACLLPPFLAGALLAGLRVRSLVWLALVGALLGGLGWQFALKDYQKSRIYTFLDPSLDPKGAGYQKIQSQIAVGSGGVSGKGYGHGTQTQLGYLPARHTDFIFSVLAEETGFVGVCMVLGLYWLLLWRGLGAAQRARDRAGAFLVAALTAGFAFQVVYNVAMVGGLVPVKGLPLPLMSYGGSSVLSSLLGVGLILNVGMRRFAN